MSYARLLLHYEFQTCTNNNSVEVYDFEDAHRMNTSRTEASFTWTGCEADRDRYYFYVSSSSTILIALRLNTVHDRYVIRMVVQAVIVTTNYTLSETSLNDVVSE